MGSKSGQKRRAARPAGASPRTSPQPSATPYAGPVESPGLSALPGPGMVAPPIGAGAADPYALSGWGESSGIGGAEDVTCPSGQVALVKRPGVQGLIEADVLNDVDSLTGLVDQKHLKRVAGGPQIDTKKLMKDPASLAKVMRVCDKVVVYCVLKPKLALAWKEDAAGNQVPLTAEEREKLRATGVQAFTDQVELDDKMFLLNYAVGGTRNLERFRQLSDAAVAGVEPGDAVEGAAQ